MQALKDPRENSNSSFIIDLQASQARQMRQAEFAVEARSGLRLSQKRISPKYFYDHRGSELFEKICETEEYYVTRTEMGILKKNANEICMHLEETTLIELGSGASAKVRILLNGIKSLTAYVPVDISRKFLLDSAQLLQQEFPSLLIAPVCADFTLPLDLPRMPIFERNKVAFFPGSTIGNFDPQEAALLLKRTAEMLGSGGKLLIGVDLVKPFSVLEAAYNDAAGVTREFNLNLLARMNAELGTDFDLKAFEHRAFFNEEMNRIEMHLVSLVHQHVRLGDQTFEFREAETIHTECSYKYTRDRFVQLARSVGFELREIWTDPDLYFGVFLLERP